MKTHISKLALAVAGAALLAGASSAPAAAVTQYRYIHHRTLYRPHHRVESSDITVRPRHREPVAAANDAFHGPAAFITAPVEVVGTFVSLPFRALEVVFPARANDPRMIIGAPVHFAGQIAGFPFYAVNGAFGVQSTNYSYR